MRVLLSAYACEPDRGSEPGIGWNWAVTMQQLGHEVTVVTRANNRDVIERCLASMPGAQRPRFIYHDLPPFFLRLKRAGLLPVQIYYLLWQATLPRRLRSQQAGSDFDLCWHLTFATIRQWSVLWRFGVPFVYGPAGGGEAAPIAMRRDYPFSGRVNDGFRDVLNRLCRFDPLLRWMFRQASLIFVPTSASGALVGEESRDKVRKYMAIGIDPEMLAENASSTVTQATGPANFLYVGRLVYLKGVTLLIRAFSEYVRLGGAGRLTIVGSGPDEKRCRSLAAELGLDHRIDWIAWVEQSRLWALYDAHSVFVFPSLHDSSGNVVIEAMARGLPVISFDLGGPKELVTAESGIVVPTQRRDAYAAAREMGRKMKHLEDDPVMRTELAAGALVRARDFTWERRVAGGLEIVMRAVPVLAQAHGRKS